MEGYVEELLGANGRSPLQKNGGERPFAPTEEWRRTAVRPYRRMAELFNSHS